MHTVTTVVAAAVIYGFLAPRVVYFTGFQRISADFLQICGVTVSSLTPTKMEEIRQCALTDVVNRHAIDFVLTLGTNRAETWLRTPLTLGLGRALAF